MVEEVPLRVKDVARQLGVNQDTVRRWLRTGKMQGKRIGGRTGFLVLPSEVRRFMAQKAEVNDG